MKNKQRQHRSQKNVHNSQNAQPRTQLRQRIVHRTSKSTSAAPAAKQPGNGGVAAVDRALAILGAFEPTDQRLTLAQLAQRTKFYKARFCASRSRCFDMATCGILMMATTRSVPPH